MQGQIYKKNKQNQLLLTLLLQGTPKTVYDNLEKNSEIDKFHKQRGDHISDRPSFVINFTRSSDYSTRTKRTKLK